MSCSKELRFPSNWAKVQWRELRKPIDESLFGLEELIKWVQECGTADEITARKYVENLNPYRSARCFCPIVPDDNRSRSLFKVLVHFFLGVFTIDDMMEKDCSLEDMEKITNAYYQLDKKVCETFPNVPSIKELQPFVNQHLPDKRITPNVVLLMDFVNRSARDLQQRDNVSDDVIFDYRQRLSTSLLLYLQGMVSEKMADTTHDTLVNVLWRRVFNGIPMPYTLYKEVSSCSLGKQQAHVTAITELHILFCLYAVIINDFYSYTKESKESFPIANVIILWLDKKEIANLSEAAPKIASILDEITKYVYKRVEKMKVENPNNSELHEMLDQIGYGIAGCYFLHEHAIFRYKDSLVRFDMKEVEENELQEWLADSDPYGWDVVKQFLYEHSTVAKSFIDISCGVTPPSVDSLRSLLNE